MMRGNKGLTNVVIAGLGGQGVLRASDILAEAAFRAGSDVKKSEIHGMSQRGGSLTSDVRFGDAVLSPMVPPGEAHYLVVLTADEVEANRWQLREGGVLIHPGMVDEKALASKRSLNVALLGVLSIYLDIPKEIWVEVVRSSFVGKLHEANLRAFALGRAAGESSKEQSL